MTYKKSLTILLPGYGWEDFPIDEPPRQSMAYVTAAAVAYHPSVIHALQAGPEWESVEAPPHLEDDYKDGLLLVGAEYKKEIDEDWIETAEAAGAEILSIDAEMSVEELLDEVFKRIDPAAIRTFPANWVADLMAVGFALLQVELITRRVQYISSLDMYSVNGEVCGAVKALVEEDEAAARDRLENVYDRLTEAREYQYPVESYQFDMTLVAPTTLGESLTEELAKQVTPINLLMTGELVERLSVKHPQTLALIAERCLRADDASKRAEKDDDRTPGTIYYDTPSGLSEEEQSMVTILGGPWTEMPCPLMNCESILANLQRGFDSYQKYLGIRPTIYARRLSGFTPMLPQILRGLGMTGVVHVGLDGKKLPRDTQSRIAWQGHGDQAIAAVSSQPVDVADAGGFLALPERLGETFEMDQAPTVAFVHWPNRSSVWHSYLRSIARHSTLLGHAMAADRYFSETYHLGADTFYAADRYRSGFLQNIHNHDGRDPISRWVRHHDRLLRFQTAKTVAMMAELAGVSTAERRLGRETLDAINDAVLHPNEEQELALDAKLAERLDELTKLFSSAIVGKSNTGEAGKQASLLVNPISTTQVVPVSGDASCQKVSGFGFTWTGEEVSREESKPEPKRSFFQRFKKPVEEPPLAEANVLRNEFFEVTLDPVTGAIRAVHDYLVRGNRLAQQIALRMADSKEVVAEARGMSEFWSEDCEERLYTIMAADSQEVLSAGPDVGRILTRGRLVDRHGNNVAGFSQTVEVKRGSRIIELEIELEPHRHPTGDPWDAYYAARFAWGDSTVDMYRSVGFALEPCEVDRIESPYFIDLRTEKMRTTILTHGLPFHRRFGLRKLDTILSVRDETAQRFRLGIAIDASIPTQAALASMMPTLSVDGVSRPATSTGWLLHLDRPNVVVTNFDPIYEGDKFVGMMVRLQEVEGARTTLRLQACRSIGTAEVTDLQGEVIKKLSLTGQVVEVALDPREWKQLKIKWA